LSITDGFSAGSVVATSPTFSPRNGATRMVSPTASATASLARSTAKGMILTVPTIRPASTGANSGSVAKVIAGSMRLSASTLARSITSTPAASAWRLDRPVNGASTMIPDPLRAAASRPAASSS